MLPMKLELTEELAATLREMRLTHPVNGKILTAENLSKAIDKNRAWMSQIESRRLKKIKREDIIKLFKLLYNEPDDYRAEYRAETNLTRFILSEQGNNKEIICGGKIDAQYSHEAYKEYREAHGGLDYTDKDLLNDQNNLVSISNDIINIFMNKLKTTKSCIDHNNYINQFMSLQDNLSERFDDTLFVIDKLPIYALNYATKEEYLKFTESINLLSDELHSISLRHNFELFRKNLDTVQMVVSNYATYKSDIKEVNLIKKIIILLVDLSNYVTNPSLLSLEDKIKYTNKLIHIVYLCSSIINSKQLFSIKDIPANASLDDILCRVNELQSYLSEAENNPYIIQGQISKYYTT